MKNLLLALGSCLFSIHCAVAQDCGSLRGENESYGDGDTFVSWCDMKTKTAYTQCMCEQETGKKRSEEEKKDLKESARGRTLEAQRLRTWAHNLTTMASLENDPSKFEKAQNLYEQAIILTEEAKTFIVQAYEGEDDRYSKLTDFYLEQYDKYIEWARKGIDLTSKLREDLLVENSKKQIKISLKKNNNWSLVKANGEEGTWTEKEKPKVVEQAPKKVRAEEMSSKSNYEIGDLFGGGIIVSLDESKKHGLIMALECTSRELVGFTDQSGWTSSDHITEKYNFSYVNYSGRELTSSQVEWYRSRDVELKLKEINDTNYNGHSDWHLPEHAQLDNIPIEDWIKVVETLYPGITDHNNKDYYRNNGNSMVKINPNLHGSEKYEDNSSEFAIFSTDGILTSTYSNYSLGNCPRKDYLIFDINDKLHAWTETYFDDWGKYAGIQIPKKVEHFKTDWRNVGYTSPQAYSFKADNPTSCTVDHPGHLRPFRTF